MVQSQTLLRNRNGLLAELTPEDRARLLPDLEEVSLQPHQVLLDSGSPVMRAYFPHDCFVSLQVDFEAGLTVETATVGAEGVVGLPLFVNQETFPARAIVQTPGRAATIPGRPLLEAIAASEKLRTLLDCYTHAFLSHALQNVACRSVHTTTERMAKWLLMATDRTRDTTISFTQELLGTALGVGRPTVSQVAGALQRAQLIHYRRGQISITDRPGLEKIACPCYWKIRSAYDSLLPAPFG